MTGKLLFFWDFDAQWGAERSRSFGGVKKWGFEEFVNTEQLLEIHDQFKIPACFAVVGSVALPGSHPYHDPELIKKISNAGHEIASHGLKHEWIPEMGIKALKRDLEFSKEILEQCIGKPITTFVPPFNQPFDYKVKGSISLSERKIQKNLRIDIPKLCDVLFEVGYRVARIAYSNIFERILSLGKVTTQKTVKMENIHGIRTIRLNGPSGFGINALTRLQHAVHKNEFVIIYGHPHSISGNTSQSLKYLLPFLTEVSTLINEKKLQIILPGDLCNY